MHFIIRMKIILAQNLQNHYYFSHIEDTFSLGVLVSVKARVASITPILPHITIVNSKLS